MVDVEVIKRILTSLDEGLSHLEAKKKVSFEGYEKDRDLQAIVERRLETSIQACIDIGNHIISQEGLGAPGDYGEIFTILGQNGIISGEDAKDMVKMAGLRNILTHEYRELLLEKVYDALQNKLGVFHTFARAIRDYLKRPRGFTLMEVLIACALLTLVIMAITGVDLVSRRVVLSGTRRVRVHEEARLAMEHMVRNIRLVNRVDAGLGSTRNLWVRMDWNPETYQPLNTPADFSDDYQVRYVEANAYGMSPPYTIQYSYRKLPAGSSPWSDWEVIGSKITSLTFTIPSQPGQPVSPAYLTIDLTAREDPTSPPDPVNNPEIRLYAGVNLRCMARWP